MGSSGTTVDLTPAGFDKRMPMRPLSFSPSAPSIAAARGPGRRGTDKTASRIPRGGHPFNILAVDDEPDYVDVLREALKPDGATVTDTEDGDEALRRVADGEVEMVLLDDPMQKVDGFETCRRMRTLPAGRTLPIFMLTADEDEARRRRAFACGASDCMHKIAALPELLAKIRVYREITILQRQLAEENRRLKQEIEVRGDLERVLVNSLDRALVLVNARGQILFQTQLATTLLFKHLPSHDRGMLPSEEALKLTPLRLRRFQDREGTPDISVLFIEEQRPEPGPKDLIALGLTPREAEVLFWISQGKTNPEIALIIGAARRTVATHVEHLLAKLEVENRACAALIAVDRLRAAIGI